MQMILFSHKKKTQPKMYVCFHMLHADTGPPFYGERPTQARTHTDSHIVPWRYPGQAPKLQTAQPVSQAGFVLFSVCVACCRMSRLVSYYHPSSSSPFSSHDPPTPPPFPGSHVDTHTHTHRSNKHTHTPLPSLGLGQQPRLQHWDTSFTQLWEEG